MNIQRCYWAQHSELEKVYHDEEWGIPVHDDHKLFELLVLESMQAGLNWALILKKRETMRIAYDNFDYQLIASYNEKQAQSLLENKGIIRNKIKIDSVITNARAFINIQNNYGSFDQFLWSYVDGEPIIGGWKSFNEVPCSSSLSDTVSAEMRKLGFKFVGTTIVYSYLQATGVLNDHEATCYKYKY